jgi:signal transduction histidine kinase
LAAQGERGRALRPRDLAELGSAAQHLVAEDDRAGIASRLERLDEQVCRLDRLAALGGLVAEIVHEIRNPLVSVKTLLELLPEQGDDPELLENFLPVALDEVRRVERLLENVLSHARPSAGSGAADVREAIASVTQLLSQRARACVVSLESDCEDALPAAAIGEDELRQVLLNLCINALDASPANGRVRIAATRDGEALRIEVRDDGPGVPSELREKLFEPFFSTKDGAAGGLGLAISRRIASACGGRLTVADAPGGGAVFELEVPVERDD